MSFELIDEFAARPLRERLGRLMATSQSACIAVAQLRIAGLDLRQSELGSLQHCRIMLGRVDAPALLDSSYGLDRPGQAALLHAFAASGRLEIRTAPHHIRNPDFSVLRASDGSPTTILGAHYFERPYPMFGLALTCFSTEQECARFCEERFEKLWQAGYDVLPVVVDALRTIPV